MNFDTIIGMSIVAIFGAVATGLSRYWTNKDLKQLQDRLTIVEVSEAKCQEERKGDSQRLLVAFNEITMLRQALPQQLVDGIKVLTEENKKQTDHLRELRGAIEGSDPTGMIRRLMRL